MFHYVNAITNTKGDALIDYYVKVVHPTTGAVMSMYADESSTPIESVSGIENACKVNADGNASFYVDDGEYHIDIYATDGATFVRRIEDVPMAKTGLLQADTKTDVANADTGYPVVLKLSGSQGFFIFDASDLSVEVAADPEQNNYIAPTSDDTGTTGAWVRVRDETAVTDSVDSRVVQGLGVAYTGNLDFTMSAGSYYLDGIFHNAAEQSLSLDAAHATLDRIDVLYVDSEGVFQKLTGTAAASPSKPSVDPTTQLELTFVVVPAAATSLTGVTTTDIYQENAEWTTSQSGTALDFASTNNPQAGTKCIETTGTFGTGNYANFATTNVAFGGDGNLIFRIRSKTTWNAKRYLLIQFWCDGVAVGTGVAFRSGSFGFDSSVTTGYQTIVISKSLFSIAAGTEVDALRITCSGSGNSVPSFYMDNIQLQTNGAVIGNSDLTQSIADARYVNVTGDTMTGDLVVPDEAYDATAWNGSLEVPTKNAVRDALEAIAPGGTVSGALLIANNLSDLNNASTARTNMGLGSIATQASSNVSITGGSVTGITDLAVADGGTGASDAATARSNLGINSTNVKLTESLIIACSDETTTLTAGTAKVTFRMPYAFTLSAVRASVTTAPTGSVLTVDINEAGVSILSTKLTIDASEKTSTTAATAAVISDSSLADDAEMTIDIDGVGSTIAGAGLKVYLIGSRT